LRVNPDVDAATHPYISTGLREHKFGIDIAEAPGVYDRARALAHLDLRGVSCHIGSQLLDTNPILDAVDKVLALIEKLREAGHDIREIDLGGGLGVAYKTSDEAPEILADVVGPVCETGDFLARNRMLANVAPGDYLAVCTAGAYGFVLASNYNSRPRPAEVLVEGDKFRVIREREKYEDLVRGETK